MRVGVAVFVLFFILSGCDLSSDQSKQEVISVEGPFVEYEPIIISGGEAGPFKIETGVDHENMLSYQSRYGITDIMSSVTEAGGWLGYLIFEAAYSFGPNRYVLIVSTGEGGRACPASTYVIVYDTKAESVIGSVQVEGCSEIVQAFAQGNKLMVKKEYGVVAVINGEIE